MNLVGHAADLEIDVENPPKTEENEGEYCMIPDIDGKLFRVNTKLSMEEEIPHFTPRRSVLFELYTRDNIREPQLLNALDKELVKDSNFNSSRPTRFVTHGWRSGGYLTTLFQDGSYSSNHMLKLLSKEFIRLISNVFTTASCS